MRMAQTVAAARGGAASSRAAATALAGASASPIARTLLVALEQGHVRYCHWKGDPQGIAAALAGSSDLDLLIDPAHAPAAATALARCGFKRFVAAPLLRDPDVEDYLALDPATSRLLHCHVHYRLIAGEPYLKDYRLPWAERLLATRRPDPSGLIYVPEPALELVFLWTRCATRLRLRDVARAALGRPCVTPSVAREHAWLCQRTDRATAVARCDDLLGARATPAFDRLVSGDITLGKLLRFRRVARAALRPWRQHGALSGRLLRWRRELTTLVAKLNRAQLGITGPVRRTRPGGGMMVAFLGSDGSGKSTLTRALGALLAPKLDVVQVYFGSGDGPGSLLRWPLRVARRLSRRLEGFGRGRRETAAGSSGATTPRLRSGPLRSVGLVLWALALAVEKRRKLRAAWQARNRGVLVLADRYPQTQLPGFNDGPLLGHLADHRHGALRALARFEAEPYTWAARHPPDLVVKLSVTPATAVRRKPETGMVEVRRRIAALGTLAFPGAAVVALDANRPLAEVLEAVERVVWNHL
jgi:energy-coupling factor transporter ATP-binding protein EcfA2